MRYSKDWEDYSLLDTSDGEKLERFGDVTLIRPDPQVIWNTEKGEIWNSADARYIRSDKGGGHWENYRSTPSEWTINYKELKFVIRPTGFKHTGIFPEQATNWDLCYNKIKNRIKEGKSVSVLNLFAYTGGATLACAAAGAQVCHVDASKGIVTWARENAQVSGLSEKPIRWIVDDCMKFIEREIRRGRKYDVIIMDPPSYGRGPGGEVWKLEEKIFPLLELCTGVLSDDAILFLLNSYTAGLNPAAMKYLLSVTIGKKFGGTTSADEIGLYCKTANEVLPCGSTAIWER